MRITTADIARPVDACWRMFTSPAALTRWVPGLREALMIDVRGDGLPREIQFEFGANLIYSLVYDYDVDDRVVRWEPRPGEHGAVRGYAQFEAVDGGTRFTYALEHTDGRKAAERAIDDPRLLVEAFARLMHEGP